jgi:GNAT superfamily N-acetyltransferase
MRRFCARPPFRRSGISRKLAAALLERPVRMGRLVTVNAATGSAAFWEPPGFTPDMHEHTHILAPRVR